MSVLRVRTVTVKLDAELDAKLNRLATKRHTSRSEILRTALASVPEEGSSTRLDAIADLVGSVDGPGDLSTNPRHLEGFGVDRPHRHRAHRRAS